MKKFKPIAPEKVDFLTKFVHGPVLRKFMRSNEIKTANKLVKENLLQKGHSVDRPHTVIYYLEEELRRDILILKDIDDERC